MYYKAPKWPYAVDSSIALDGGPPTVVSMTGPNPSATGGEETIIEDILWSATGLVNTEHQVVVTKGAVSPFTVVDCFM